MSELAKEMLKRGIASPFDLIEEDQWVNDATRKDIKNVVIKHNFKVFGLKFWTWNKKRGRELLDVRNFEVDLIFKDENEPKVDGIIQEYKRPFNSLCEIQRLVVNEADVSQIVTFNSLCEILGINCRL